MNKEEFDQMLRESLPFIAVKTHLERLEGMSPAGSGAADGCAGREAGGQPADEEARSVESRAVAPGEAEATLHLLEWYDKTRSQTYSSLANRYRKTITRLLPFQFLAKAKCLGAAEVLEDMADSWSKLKADSDADEPEKVTVEAVFGVTHIGNESENKRSVRRNAKEQECEL